MMRWVVLKKLWRVQRSDQENFPDVKPIVSHKKSYEESLLVPAEGEEGRKNNYKNYRARSGKCLFCVEKNSQLANVIPKNK